MNCVINAGQLTESVHIYFKYSMKGTKLKVDGYNSIDCLCSQIEYLKSFGNNVDHMCTSLFTDCQISLARLKYWEVKESKRDEFQDVATLTRHQRRYCAFLE